MIVHLNDDTNDGMMGKKMPAVLEEAFLSKSNSSDGSDINLIGIMHVMPMMNKIHINRTH